MVEGAVLADAKSRGADTRDAAQVLQARERVVARYARSDLARTHPNAAGAATVKALRARLSDIGATGPRRDNSRRPAMALVADQAANALGVAGT